MKFYTDERLIISWVTVPSHLCGWNNLVHGGIISTLLDEVMGWTGIYLLKKILLTKTLTVDFSKAVFVDKELKVEGKVLHTDYKRQAIIEGSIYNTERELCAKATGTFTLISPAVAKKFGIMDDNALKNFFEPLINS